MNEKYGRALTGSDWAGLPLRVGHFAGSGCLEDLVTETDSVLVWTGGVSEVRINAACGGTFGPTDRKHEFVRHTGAIDLLPRGTRFNRITWQGQASECVAVNFPEETLSALMGVGCHGLDPCAGTRLSLVDAHVVDLVKRLQTQAATGQPLGAAYVQGVSLALAAYVSQRFGPRRSSPAGPEGLSSISREKVRAFIEEHLNDNLGLVDLAALAGYSPDHFARLFKQSFGTTPHRYLVARRVEKAKAMLRDRDCTLANIAHSCGFSSQTHLNVAFKRHTGVTPGTYRRG